jgi:N-acetylglucosamine-6-phosphate deacetylase
MASTWPAEFLGLGASRGRIAAGYQADFVIMGDCRVRQSWIAGAAQRYEVPG